MANRISKRAHCKYDVILSMYRVGHYFIGYISSNPETAVSNTARGNVGERNRSTRKTKERSTPLARATPLVQSIVSFVPACCPWAAFLLTYRFLLRCQETMEQVCQFVCMDCRLKRIVKSPVSEEDQAKLYIHLKSHFGRYTEENDPFLITYNYWYRTFDR